MSLSQSQRMESELNELRNLFADARLNDDAPRMISLSRVIIQHEKEIAKMRKEEGLTLTRDQVLEMIDEVSMVFTETAKSLLPEDTLHLLIDRVCEQMRTVWENKDERHSLQSD